jgi:hypothetical protein
MVGCGDAFQAKYNDDTPIYYHIRLCRLFHTNTPLRDASQVHLRDYYKPNPNKTKIYKMTIIKANGLLFIA